MFGYATKITYTNLTIFFPFPFSHLATENLLQDHFFFISLIWLFGNILPVIKKVLQLCSVVCDPAKIFPIFKFSYLFISNTTHETKTGTANR